MSPPLAGKPPFATDEPDSYYDGKDGDAPRRRAPPPKPDNPNKRTSAYDVYDTYLTANDPSSASSARPVSAVSTTSRNSGIGGIGMGLLAMDSDSDDDSDDEEAYERKRKAEQARRNAASNAGSGSSPDPSKGGGGSGAGGAGNSRTAALAAAIHANTPSPPNSPPPSPPPPSPKPIAAPKPGYAAPTIANLGVKSPAPSEGENPFEPSHQHQQQGRSPFDNPPQGMRGPPGPGMPHPQHQQQQRGPPMPAPIHGMPQPMPHRQDSNHSINSGSSHGFRGPPPGLGLNTGLLPPHSPGGMLSSPHSPITPPPGAMVRGMTPAPLAPPMTPIMPVFAVPTGNSSSPGPGEKGGPGVKWDESAQPIPRKPIMRSNTEDALLPRRGEKGDDFWRRFSMVAHLEEKAPGKGKGSVWLRKTQSGTSRLSKWVWVIGLVLLGAIGAAIGLGVYFTKDNPDHQQPEALSGEVGTQKADGVTSVKGGTGSGTAGGSTVKHVSPTHTIDARGWVGAVVTPSPVLVYRNANLNVGVEGRGVGEEEVREESPCPKETATEPARREEGRARREHVRQGTSRKRRF